MYLGVSTVYYRWCRFIGLSIRVVANTRQRPQQIDNSRLGMGYSRSYFIQRIVVVGGCTRCRIQLDLHSKVLGLEYFIGKQLFASNTGENDVWNIFNSFCFYCLIQIQHLTTATLIWLFTRHDLNNKFKPIVTLLLIATPFKLLWTDILLKTVISGLWTLLAFKALITCCIGVATLHIYTDLAQSIGI